MITGTNCLNVLLYNRLQIRLVAGKDSVICICAMLIQYIGEDILLGHWGMYSIANRRYFESPILRLLHI